MGAEVVKRKISATPKRGGGIAPGIAALVTVQITEAWAPIMICAALPDIDPGLGTHQETSVRMWSNVALAIAGVAVGAPVCGAAIPGQGTWRTTLLERDLYGRPVSAFDRSAVFAYDTVLDMTWYLTANTTGGLNWEDAKRWAAGLTVGAVSGWTLPVADPACGLGPDCVSSPMGELWYTALGGVGGAGKVTDSHFKNLGNQYYWLGTEYALNPIAAWTFGTSGGDQSAQVKDGGNFALAVRAGDVPLGEVPAVPEPGTYAMLFVGLAIASPALWHRTRHRPKGAGA